MGPLVGNFTGVFTSVHSDTPVPPHVVHSVVHKRVLTGHVAGLSFAGQESPGLRAARHFWGRGANGPQRSERLLAMSLRCPGTLAQEEPTVAAP
jgi:hypothetical protein